MTKMKDSNITAQSDESGYIAYCYTALFHRLEELVKKNVESFTPFLRMSMCMADNEQEWKELLIKAKDYCEREMNFCQNDSAHADEELPVKATHKRVSDQKFYCDDCMSQIKK